MQLKNLLITALILTGAFSGSLLRAQEAKEVESKELETISPEDTEILRKRLTGAQDNETILIEDGIYRDLGRIEIKADNVLVSPENRGQVVFSGSVQIVLRGRGSTLDSLIFRDGGPVIDRRNPTDVRSDIRGAVVLYGEGNTFSNSIIEEFNQYPYEADINGEYPNVRWVTVAGTGSKVIGNTLDGKYKRGAFLVVQTGEDRDDSLIQNNIFRNLIPRDLDLIREGSPEMFRTNANDRQAIRLGDARYSRCDSGAIIKDNLFDTIDGELEMISLKASAVSFEGNTLRNSSSMISLRHGSNMTIRDNVILGDGKSGSGGIRFYDEGHIIENNYIQGVLGSGETRGGLVVNTGVNDVQNGEPLDNGTPGKELNKQWTPMNITIANNSIIDCRQGFMLSTKTHKTSLTEDTPVELVYPGVNITFENNLILARENHTLAVKGAPSREFELIDPVFKNNLFAGPREHMDHLPEGVSDESIPVERNGIFLEAEDYGARNLVLRTDENTGSDIFRAP